MVYQKRVRKHNNHLPNLFNVILRPSIFIRNIYYKIKLFVCRLGDEDQMKLIQETVQAIAHPSPRYDVFISFCGEDTRYSFTGHLYRALCRKGLRTFMDDEGLVSGNEISNNLIEAIHSSKLSWMINCCFL